MNGLYALLAVPFLAVAVLVAVAAGIVAARRAGSRARAVSGRRIALVSGLVAGVALLVMTVVFNNVIVTLSIVAYDPARISGVRIGAFPIEDLAYAIGAAFLLPALWVLFDRSGGRDRVHGTGSTTRTQPRPEPEDPR
ncbi:lycopene cyclase domain-containing protein [Microbacterium sp. M1A1_1b]|uniref:lycopene cyclase domain-containing protein n=1 Tax=Curtobacterium sp. VKM Ac-2922 TaxID=2929475 RepID=UPI001FB2E383|nr:lycopene cyclase domain-containing protein [Curtobacterium sp. VKM Ac-2922]MCJ1714052.1 lycopene cyclase domain-containing protein [Curtobacterium sp. VKM Ac-2922]